MIKEKAYAKVNLGLQVCKKNSNGFHDLQMVIVPISLHDTLTFSDDKKIIIEVNNSLIKTEDNLVYQVATYLKKKYKLRKGAKITIDKQIPIGAGLGGGSSDAAATIRGLTKLWNLNLSIKEAEKIGAQFGSDVPFFISTKAALIEGRGERINHLKRLKKLNMILLYPKYQTKTKDVFAKVSDYCCDNRIDKLLAALQNGSEAKIVNLMFNDLTKPSALVCSENGLTSPYELQNLLRRYKPLGTIMSGSGSTILAFWENESITKALFAYFKVMYPEYEFFNVMTK